MSSYVNDPPAAGPSTALEHFAGKLGFETDAWTVYEGLHAAKPDFVLIDVRGPAEFADGHVPGAINIPYLSISEAQLSRYPGRPTFVVYGAGPHCNRADKAAVQLAKLCLPVKIMIGGLSGWREEGYPLEIEPGAVRPDFN